SCSMRLSSCMVTNRFSSRSMGEKIRSRLKAPSSIVALTLSSSSSLALVIDSPDGATYSDPPQKLTPSSNPTRLQYSTRQLRNMAVVDTNFCQALAVPSDSPSTPRPGLLERQIRVVALSM